jgi:hypothetical protein
VPTKNNHARQFFNELRIGEEWNSRETEAKVTYSYRGKRYRLKRLHYHPEKLWHPKLGRAVYRSHVLDWHKHEDWPEGHDNTDKIIEDMLNRCRDDKESCRVFLRELRDQVHAALVRGEPGRLRYYWPNILNNNHWHDVAGLIKLCTEDPEGARLLVDQSQEGKDAYPLDRLVYRWLPAASRGKGAYKGIDRVAFHGNYRMIEGLLSAASPARSQAHRKYGSGGEGKEHRLLKKHFERHPEQLGLNGIVRRQKEYAFISGDSADLVFWHKHGNITIVEIETDIPHPGAHQLIKYRALMCAEGGLRLDSPKVRAILVAWSLPSGVRAFCRKYGMSWQEHRLPKQVRPCKFTPIANAPGPSRCLRHAQPPV